jgi:hypothetical protein
MKRAAVVESYRELAGITNPDVAIGPPLSRQAGMREAFAASARALELPDDAAMLKAMGHGELAAQVREYERAQAVAPPDVRAEIDLSDGARADAVKRAEQARQARHHAEARAAEDLERRMEAHRARLQVAAAARLEWEEAVKAKAEAASQARAELEARGPARPDEHSPQASHAETAEPREVQADEPAAAPPGAHAPVPPEAGHETTPAAQPERQPEHGEPETGYETRQPEHGEPETGYETRREAHAGAGAWPEAHAEIAADVDPEALTVMAEADADMTAIRANREAAEAGAQQLAEQRAHAQAERDQAVINEPAGQAQAQAEAQAELATATPQADDVEMEI